MKSQIDAIIRKQQAEYLDSLMPAADALLAEIEKHAAEFNQPIADPEVAQLMRILVATRRPKRVFEVGTNIGYSVIVMGRELARDAVLETVEIDHTILTTAKRFVKEAQLGCDVVFHEGDALEVLEAVRGPFDFAFIDCVKTDYIAYLDLLLPKMTSGALIVADNVLWKGQVAEGPRDEKQKASTAALKEFNARIMSDERLTSIVLPLGDGVSLSYVR